VRQPKSTRLGSAFVRAIRGAGGAPRFKVKTGTADMNLLVPAWGCPAVAYGPGDSHLDHTPDEHIDIEDLHRSVEVLTSVLADL
jgi:LysW-gamma-L-lysine carboxypeptidase